jgi:hypothetical protein
MALNKYFLIHADHNRYVVFTSEYVNTTYNIKTISNPLGIFGECTFSGKRKGESICIDIYNENDSKVYSTQMTRLKRFIYVRGIGKIYEYTIHNLNPCLPLPNEYYDVFVGKDITCSFHLCIKEPVVNLTIPAHVLKGFVDGLILAKETCPITLDEFTSGNIALTGCYHAFSKDAFNSLQNSTCPSCRAKLSKKKTRYY